MAGKKTTATLILLVKDKATSGIKGVIGSMKNIASAALGPVAAITAVGAVITKLGLQGAELDNVKRSFKALAVSQGNDADAILNKMREMSKGTITDLELMKQANQAALLGLPIDRFDDMLTIARSSSLATGESMEFMLNSIVTGLGRGSRMMLDNLGILVNTDKAYEKYARTLGKTANELSEAERKQAFINEALSVGKANAKAAGSENETFRDSWEQLKTTSINLANSLGQILGPTLVDITKSLTKYLNFFNKIGLGATTEEQKIISLNAQIVKLQKAREEAASDKGGFLGFFEKTKEQMDEEVVNIDRKIAKLKEEVKAVEASEKEKITQIAAGAEARKAIEAQRKEEENIRKEEEALLKEEKDIEKEQELENEKIFEELMTQEKVKAQIDRLNKLFLNESNHKKKMALLEQKEQLKKDLINTEKDKKEQDRLTAMSKFKALLNSKEVSDAQSVFSQISTLQNSHSKTQVAIGKAAGIANAIINTSRGVTLALATFPTPINYAMAAAVAAAGAAQIKTIAGVKLAEGGIVMPTAGGTPAIIGEAGKPEAVIPLDNANSPIGNTNINITVNGGLLGTQAEAREFAIAVDQELFNLRKNNESLAFDTGLI